MESIVLGRWTYCNISISFSLEQNLYRAHNYICIEFNAFFLQTTKPDEDSCSTLVQHTTRDAELMLGDLVFWFELSAIVSLKA